VVSRLKSTAGVSMVETLACLGDSDAAQLGRGMTCYLRHTIPKSRSVRLIVNAFCRNGCHAFKGGSQVNNMWRAGLTDSAMDNMSMLGDFPRIDERIHASESSPREALHAKEGIGGSREQGHSGRDASN
jgi:hypothetical protein